MTTKLASPSKFYKLLIGFGAILLTAIITTVGVNAQEATGVSISPLVFEINGDPGDTITNQVKITNPTDSTVSIEINLEDFSPVGEDGDVALQEVDPNDENIFSIARWATFSPSTFVLEPNEQQLVAFTIVIPENGEPGGHYGSITAKTNVTSGDITGSNISAKIGSLVLLRVSGDIEESLEIESFTAPGRSDSAPINFETRLKNTGNVHLKPTGIITITDIFGKEVDKIAIDQNNVIPDAIRKIETEWDKGGLFGRYVATLVVNYGTGDTDSVTSTVTFWVYPVRTIVIASTVIVGVVVLMVIGRDRVKMAFEVLVKGENPKAKKKESEGEK